MKTIIKIFLSFVIAISPIFLINSANAAVGGWSMGNPVAVGASTVYEGTKQVIINGSNYIKTGTAKITPVASQVSKVLARGAAGYALSVAVEQLLGSVDWVLDPANNQVKYWEKTDPNSRCSGASAAGPVSGSFKNASELCQGYITKYPSIYKSFTITETSTCKFTCTFQNGDTVAVTSKVVTDAPEKEEKTIPLETVAQKVISNAESGDSNAQVATTAAAADIVAEAEKDDSKARPIAQQLESSAQTKPADEAAAEKANEAQGQSKPNTQNPEAMDLSLDFPVFCGWAPLVCEAAQTVISFPQTLTNWWETGKSKAEEWATSISEAWISFRDWFKSDDDLPDDERPQISEIPTPELKEDAIRWSAQCPADAQVPISMQGVSSTITFSWSPWCQLLDMIKPAIIASAYIGAAFIVLGLRT